VDGVQHGHNIMQSVYCCVSCVSRGVDCLQWVPVMSAPRRNLQAQIVCTFLCIMSI